MPFFDRHVEGQVIAGSKPSKFSLITAGRQFPGYLQRRLSMRAMKIRTQPIGDICCSELVAPKLSVIFQLHAAVRVESHD